MVRNPRSPRQRPVPAKAEVKPAEPEPAPKWAPRADPFSGIPLPGILLVILVMAVLATRFTNLGVQAFHHDESIHCLNAWKITHQGCATYRYDPVYHGPFLYFWGALFQKFFPDSDFTARAAFATSGCLLVLLFLFWKNRLGWGTSLLIAFLLTLSGVVTYFSRFAREDVHMLMALAGTLVFGVLYLWSRRVFLLTLSVFFLVLSYTVKESSYINAFAPCSFLVGWGVIRVVAYRRKAVEEILQDYLPLVRVLILVGAFSVFVFSYAAIDSRVSPETGLVEGVRRILTHSTSISKQYGAEAFAKESGYFTQAGREGVRLNYLRLAFGSTLAALLAAEAGSLWLRGRSRRDSLVRLFAFLALAVLFHLLFLERWIHLAQWARSAKPDGFLPDLLEQLAWCILPLLTVPLFFLLPDLLMNRKRSGSVEREHKPLWREWNEYLFGLWGLVLQVALAVGLYLVLFSSLGTNVPGGPSAGLYNYLTYWFKHQTGDYRIWGPWWYYIPRLLLFDLLPMTLIAGLLVLFAQETVRSVFRASRAGTSTWREAILAARSEVRVQSLLVPSEIATSAYWKPVPLPLLFFTGYLTVFLFGIYAILNEKVPWLCTYQSFAVTLFAALLSGHWLATHPNQPGPVIGRLLDLTDRSLAASHGLRWVRVAALRVLVFLLLAFLFLFSAGQHLTQVFFRPDYSDELLVYTATTHEFAAKIRKIDNMRREAGAKLRIAVDGKSEWPCAWYFRNDDVRWKSVDLSRDIQILDDTSENRRRLQPRRGKIWDLEACHLRGWWIWHGTPDALPGQLKFLPNLKAFLANSANDRREKFPKEDRPGLEDYPLGFRNQVLSYAFFRRGWYPKGGENVLVCFKTDQEVSQEATEGYLEGSDSPPQVLQPSVILGQKGTGPGQLNEPRGIALTPSGDLAVADSKNGRIEILSATGTFRSEIGKGILSSQHSGVSDLAFGDDGSIYVADTWNHALRKFTPGGELLQSVSSWTVPGQEVPKFFGPRGVAVSSRNEIYLADTGHKRVRVFDQDLKPLRTWGGAGDQPGQFNEPVGIALDAQDRVYVADTGNGRIQQFNSQGVFEKEFLTVTPLENEVVGIEPNLDILPDGRIALTSSNTGTFWIIDPERMKASVFRVPQGRFLQPLGICSDNSGGIWISSRSSAAIGRFKLP